MKYDYALLKKIYKLGEDLSGVFSTSDISNIIGIADKITVSRTIKKLLAQGVLTKYIRGIYVTDKFDPEVLSSKIYPGSYISFGNVLAKNLIIGSIPDKTIQVIKIGKRREFYNNDLRIMYYGLRSELFFGYVPDKKGVRYATPEKAFLDVLYFYQRGVKYSFNIFQDINIFELDLKLIKQYLKIYKNKKFVKFVHNYLRRDGNQIAT